MKVIEPIVLQGHVIDKLREMEPESVHCVVTSPPYWGLRDYGVEGQIGLEPTPETYVAKMVEVFREVRKVMRPDSTLWLNLGDSYSQGGGAQVLQTKNASHGLEGMRAQTPGMASKQLLGIPWRVALALQADGWYLRSDIIWYKANVMPESVTDRPTKSYEHVFLLAKSGRYYYDQEAIKEESSGLPSGNTERVASKQPNGRSHVARNVPWDGRGGRNKRDVWKPEMSPEWFYLGVLEYLEQWLTEDEFTRFVDDFKDAASQADDTWSINTQPFPGAHFAVWPEALVEPMIKAGTSERGVCPICGAPWRRVVARPDAPTVAPSEIDRYGTGKAGVHRKIGGQYQKFLDANPPQTTGWVPTCTHDAEPVPATVLDPFGGSGTTGLVATRLGRKSILIELNPEYVVLAQKRCAQLGMAF